MVVEALYRVEALALRSRALSVPWGFPLETWPGSEEAACLGFVTISTSIWPCSAAGAALGLLGAEQGIAVAGPPQGMAMEERQLHRATAWHRGGSSQRVRVEVFLVCFHVK